MLTYAGIGSRQTPHAILDLMSRIAEALELRHYVLRSGGADGADTAFERGTHDSEIYLPWPGYNRRSSPYSSPTPEAFTLAAQFHPNWAACSPAARKLHARNCHIVLGPKLDDPVRFIVCWTPGAAITGGTGQALRLAKARCISIRNLADPDVLKTAQRFINPEVPMRNVP